MNAPRNTKLLMNLISSLSTTPVKWRIASTYTVDVKIPEMIRTRIGEGDLLSSDGCSEKNLPELGRNGRERRLLTRKSRMSARARITVSKASGDPAARSDCQGCADKIKET